MAEPKFDRRGMMIGQLDPCAGGKFRIVFYVTGARSCDGQLCWFKAGTTKRSYSYAGAQDYLTRIGVERYEGPRDYELVNPQRPPESPGVPVITGDGTPSGVVRTECEDVCVLREEFDRKPIPPLAGYDPADTL